MTSEQCELLLDYFNGQLTKEQREAFEAHLAECESCQEELLELQQLTEDLPYSSEPVEPPEGMKKRVLSNVIGANTDTDTNDNPEPDNITSLSNENRQPKKKRSGWYKPLVAAVLTISLVGNGAALVYLTNSNEEQGAEQEPEQTDTDFSLDAVQQTQDLQPSEGITAEANAMLIEQNDNMNLVVQASDLPQLEGEETYQVWMLEGENPYRAGTFVTDQDGFGAVSYLMDYEEDHNFDTIAITKEPDADSQEPQGDILLSSPL
ncbi:anti-sigma factor [Virgibacillus natechei]|uniref:anti-sigma factor n=1 Tax=Virgibacillus sp. CBA3643 TaxID=2942278 RepID=UPI0035A27CB3